MTDCHRRIEMFLGALERLAAEAERILLPDRREALERALRYFERAAPRHTEDEEESLFPRMRASGDPKLREALAELETLEGDHARAAGLHEEVERLCRNWLRFGSLEPGPGATLRATLAELAALYRRHIELEERVVFAAAAGALDAAALAEIGREMAERRGVAWGGSGA